MLCTEIFGDHNNDAYQELLAKRNLELDIYYQSSFLRADAFLHRGTYEIFVCYNDEDIFIYPYVKKAIREGYVDLSSPYGYCGPFVSNHTFFNEGETAFLDYVKNNGKIVSEFVRYHPLYNKDQLFFQQQVSNSCNRTIVMADLSPSWNAIWMQQLSPINRNLVRRLQKEDYRMEVVDFKDYREEFRRMYYATMHNVNATAYYYFDTDYFRILEENLGRQLMMTKVHRDGVTCAIGLFFISGSVITYYLSARNLEFSKVAGTNLLLTGMMQWGQERGYTFMNLGGGLTNAPDDSLFKFKSNFSKDYLPFYIGKRIHQPEVYKHLTENWISANGMEKYLEKKHILQFYH